MSNTKARQPASILASRAADNQQNTAHDATPPCGKSATQVPRKKLGGVGKNTTNYWASRIYRPVNSRGEVSPHYQMRVKFKGRRVAFGLGTGNKDAAAARAAAIYADILALGIEGALAKHRPEAVVAKDRTATVGEWIEAAGAVTDASDITATAYARALRKIAADLLAVKRTKKRFGPKKGGAARFRAEVDAANLNIFTPAAVQQWRLAYVKKAKNPVQERSRMTSCNSTIRQARSLFADKIVRFLDLRLPDPPPFAGVQFYPRQSAKYFSRIDPKALLQKAQAELAEADPPAFLAMLLALSAGLRRGEIDSLTWRQVDFDRQLVRIEATEKAGLKTTDSRDEVAIDQTVTAILRGRFAKVNRLDAYVIEAEGVGAGKAAWGQHYRADAVFTRLTEWLRANGVEARKPLHELRKELGALVTAEHGIYAASRVLRHSNVATTAAHYTDLKTRPVVNVGAWLAGGADNVVAMPAAEQPSAPQKPRRRAAK